MTASVHNIKVLVVDDSPLVRKVISEVLRQDPSIRMVDTAGDGAVAMRKIKKMDPDVVTLDVQMPKLDGLSTLQKIMAHSPRPVIMLSAFTSENARQTIRALELGAIDFIEKPSGRLSKDIMQVGALLVQKVKMAAKSRRARKPHGMAALHSPVIGDAARLVQQRSCGVPGVVAVGASTGGTMAIREILSALPVDFPCGILVVQHMPANFTTSFAQRLNEHCALEVKEAAQRDLILPGRVLIAPGHSHMIACQGSMGNYVELHQGPPRNRHRPSVDELFDSVATVYSCHAVGVLLTGMGNDGALGLGLIKDSGSITIAQDEQSCVVFGMPKAAIKAGAASLVAELASIAAILQHVLA